VPGTGGGDPDNRGTRIDPRLGRRDEDTVIIKNAASALFATNLGTILASEPLDTVGLAGAVISACIRAIGVDLVQYRCPSLSPRECVRHKAPEPHDTKLLDADAKYCDVVSLRAAVEYLASATATRIAAA
jgi:maleamate amidohydrolase